MNPFLARYKEKTDLNQYWYSKPTIMFMVEQCQTNGTRVAFLSTPSIYFSLKDKELKANSVCFDVSKVLDILKYISLTKNLVKKCRPSVISNTISTSQKRSLNRCTVLSTWLQSTLPSSPERSGRNTPRPARSSSKKAASSFAAQSMRTNHLWLSSCKSSQSSTDPASPIWSINTAFTQTMKMKSRTRRIQRSLWSDRNLK